MTYRSPAKGEALLPRVQLLSTEQAGASQHLACPQVEPDPGPVPQGTRRVLQKRQRDIEGRGRLERAGKRQQIASVELLHLQAGQIHRRPLSCPCLFYRLAVDLQPAGPWTKLRRP